MADVDTSIYANRSPLDYAGKAVGVLQGLNQNRLFQQTIQSKQALSQIYQQAIDPNTGAIDTDKLNKLMQSNPNISLGLPEATAGAQALRSGQLGIQKQQFDLAQAHLQAMSGRISSLLATQQPLTQKDVINQVGSMIAEKLLTPEEAANELQNMPQDDAGIRSYLTQHLLRYQDAGTRLNALKPAPVAVDTGAGTQFAAPPPQFGPGAAQQAPGNFVPSQLSPAAKAQMIDVVDPNTGKSYKVPLSSLVTPQGTAPGTGGPPAGAPAQGAPPVAPQASAAPGLPAGAVQTGLRPGQGEAMADTGHGSAHQGLSLQAAADQVPTMKATLGNMEGLLDKFPSGPGSEWFRNAQSGLNTALSQFGIKPSVNASSVASQENFNKLANQLAQQQFAAIGGTGTDAKLDSAYHTSPNTMLSNLGNKEIITLLKGNADAISVKNREWQRFLQNGGTADQYGQFSTAFNQHYDPRIFQMQYMPADKRKSLFKTLSPSEQKTLIEQGNYALKNGWVSPPSK